MFKFGNNNSLQIKQWLDFNGQLLHLLTITEFKYFYSTTKKRYYLGYYTITGEWKTIMSEQDEDVIKQIFNTLKEELNVERR